MQFKVGAKLQNLELLLVINLISVYALLPCFHERDKLKKNSVLCKTNIKKAVHRLGLPTCRAYVTLA